VSRRRRLLVLRALNLGDLLTIVPALRALRRRFTDHHLVVAGPAALAPLVTGPGLVDTVVATPGLVDPLPSDLHDAALAVNLHGRGPQSSRLLAAAAPGRLLAFAHPAVAETAGGPSWDDDEHEVRRWCRLVAEVGAVADPTDLRLPPPPCDPPAFGAGTVVVHPGAMAPARRWPAERFAAIVAWLAASGHRVAITGSTPERGLAEEIARRAETGPGAVTVLAGRTTIVQLAALVAAATLVIAGDTGVAHLATAYGTPSVVLFGPTPPSAWGPLTGGPHRVLWAGRRGDPRGSTVDPGLLAIGPGDVQTAAQDLLETIAASPAPGRRSLV
jgi:ADP-heptose:LPS heptosyltransferase